MNRFVLVMFAVTFLFNPFSLADENSDQVDQLFARWDHDDSPGATIAVIRDGETLYSSGYGMANLEHQIANTPETVFHVASVSKQFTAFAIFLLEQDEKLSLEDDIRTHLPELPDFGEVIRIRHLIHHTSGLRDQWELLVLAGWRMDDVITHSDVMQLVEDQQELNFSPGDKYLYCNTGYTLLAELVQRLTGKSLREFCEEQIFLPLEMSNTHFHDDHRQIVPHRADGYWPKEGGWQRAVLSYAIVGATSLHTTAGDLAKWQRNLENRTLGSKRVHKHLAERAVLNNGEKINYAGGVYHGRVSDHATLGHSGGDAGYVCHVERFTQENLSIIVLANTSDVPAASLAHQVGMVYLEEEKNDGGGSDLPNTSKYHESSELFGNRNSVSTVQRSVLLAPLESEMSIDLDGLAGRYFSAELDVSYEMISKDDQLFLRRRKYGSQLCRPTGEDSFRVSSGLSLAFKVDRDVETQEVVGFRVSSGRVKDLKFRKVAE